MGIKRDIVIIITLVAILAFILYLSASTESVNVSSGVPTATTTENSGTSSPIVNGEKEVIVTAKISAPAESLGITIAPLEITEDSRCPTEVTCIQAGTVRVRIKIINPDGERALTATLNKPISSSYETIELVNVLPEARAEIPIRTNEYRFEFKITKL